MAQISQRRRQWRWPPSFALPVVSGVTLEQLAAATAGGNPAILAMSLTRGGHAVVVDGVTMRAGQAVVAILDPALGWQYFTPVEQFVRQFSGQAIFTGR